MSHISASVPPAGRAPVLSTAPDRYQYMWAATGGYRQGTTGRRGPWSSGPLPATRRPVSGCRQPVRWTPARTCTLRQARLAAGNCHKPRPAHDQPGTPGGDAYRRASSAVAAAVVNALTDHAQSPLWTTATISAVIPDTGHTAVPTTDRVPVPARDHAANPAATAAPIPVEHHSTAPAAHHAGKPAPRRAQTTAPREPRCAGSGDDHGRARTQPSRNTPTHGGGSRHPDRGGAHARIA